jgi:hypothetical protein
VFDGPLVSILTPSYNQSRWLPANLESVRNQTYPHIEHVVMDGGSTDGSADVLREAGDAVVWRSEPDAGQSDALNKAFSASKGQIIGWINSDDGYFSTTAVEEAVALFQRRPDVDLVYGHSAYVNSEGLLLHLMWAPGFIRWWFMRQDYISQPTVFLRRSALGDRLVDVSFHFAMDYELWLRLLTEGRRLARIDSVLAFERVQPDRKSLRMTDVLAEDTARLARRYGVVVEGKGLHLLLSGLGVLSRFMGVRLIPRSLRTPAYSAPPVRRRDVLRRQIAERRSNMHAGG